MEDLSLPAGQNVSLARRDVSSSPHPASGRWLVYCGKVTSPLFPTPSEENINV